MNKNIVLLSVFLLSNIPIHSADFNTKAVQPNPSEPSDIYPDDIYPDGISNQFSGVHRTASENWQHISGSKVTNATNQQYVIGTSGNYSLTSDIAPTVATGATSVIHINVDNVVLDLAGHTIDGSNATDAGTIAIEVSGHKNITIQNGHIISSKGEGINVAASSDNIRIYNMNIEDTAGTYDAIMTTTGTNFIFKNIQIMNDTGSTGHGINVSGTTQDLTIENFHINGIATQNRRAIQLASGCYGVKIKNGTITNVEGNTGSDGIFCAGACYDMQLSNINIANVAGKGIDLNASYGIQMYDITIANITGGHAIDLGAGYNFELDTFKISNISATSSHGINLGGGAYGITIKNGTITKVVGATSNGITAGTTVQNVTIKDCNISASTTTNIAFGAGCYGIVLDNVQSTGGKDGITLIGTAGTANIVSDVVIKNCNISGTTRSDDIDTKGLNCTFAQNILIQDTTVGKCNVTTAGEEAFGVYLSTCTNVKCKNVNSGGHLGDGASGFCLINVNGAVFNNCESQGNYAIDSTSTETCAGFFVQTSTAVRFNKCVSSGHIAGREAHGFLYGNATGCIAESCIANSIRNSATVPNSTEAMFTGFYSVNGIGNMWKNCISENNFAGTAVGAPGEGAIGFYLSSELQSALFGCRSRGHGSLYGHTANAIGIYLDNRRSYKLPAGNFMKKEDCQYCQVRACEASSNCTSALSGVTAYGIRDDSSQGTKNIIIECFAFGNSDSASIRVVTNYEMNLAIGAQTAANWPRLETNMDGLIDLANTPDYYNVSITS